MSRLGSMGQQFVKGTTKVIKEVAKDAAGSAAKEGAVAFAEALTGKRSRGSMEKASTYSAPIAFSVAGPPPPPPVQFPALCVCKYEPDAPDLSDGNKQYICSSCSRSGMGEYRTVIEGRAFAARAPLKGGKKTRRRSRLHLTKRIRVRHNGRSRR